MRARIASSTDRLQRHAPFLFTLVLLPQLPLFAIAAAFDHLPVAPSFRLLLGGAYFLLLPFVYGALLHALSRLNAGGEIHITEAYRAAGAAYHRMLVAYILSLLAVLFGFILLIIPGIAIAVKICLTPCVALFEGQGDLSALRRSWDLTKGLESEALAYGLVIVLPPLAFRWLTGIILGSDASGAALALAGFLAQLVSLVSGVVFLTLIHELYRDAAAVQRPTAAPGEVLMVPIKPGEGKQ